MRYAVFLATGISIVIVWGCASKSAQSETDDTDTATDTSDTSDTSQDTALEGPAGDITWITMEPRNFVVGSPETEWGRSSDELQHDVTHIHRYAIAATEITCGQWNAVGTDDSNLCAPLECDANEPCIATCTEDDCPVARMSVDKAKRWMDALSVAAGLTPCYENQAQWKTPYHCPGFRFPTESEWEQAARGRTTQMTYNGDFDDTLGDAGVPDALEPIAWCGASGMTQEERKPRPAAQGDPNAYGLYDVIGNVAEIVTWDGIYQPNPPASPYLDMDSGYISLRGGSYDSYYSNFTDCRLAARNQVNALSEIGRIYVGLRPVRTLPGGELPESQLADWCPAPISQTACSTTEPDTAPLLHTYSADATYADIDARGEYIVTVGNSATDGTFIEVSSIDWDYPELAPFTAYTPTAPDPALTASHVALSDAYPPMAYSVLCNTEECILYRLGNSSDPLYAPISGGEIPAWVGEVQDFIVNVNPLEFIVAGDGITRFNGTEWTELVAPLDGAHFTAVHSVEASTGSKRYAAVGTNGTLYLDIGNGEWAETDSGTTSNLSGVVLHTLNSRPVIMAVGENGTLLTGPMDQFSSCQLGAVDFTNIIGTYGYNTDKHALIDAENNFYTYVPDSTQAISCSASGAPTGAQAVNVICGIADNPLYLSPEGLYGNAPICAIE